MHNKHKVYTADQTTIKEVKTNQILFYFLKIKRIFKKNQKECLYMFMNENLSVPFVLETSISEGLYIVLAPSWYIVTRSFNFDFKTL